MITSPPSTPPPTTPSVAATMSQPERPQSTNNVNNSTDYSSSDSDDDQDRSNVSTDPLSDDQDDSEDEAHSWMEELEALPLNPRKPARLSRHIRIGRVSGERRLPDTIPLTFDAMVRSPTMFVKKLTQVKKLCADSMEPGVRLTLLRRPSGFGKTSLLSMVVNVLDVNRREEFSRVFGEFSLLEDKPWLEEDPLLLALNLDNLPSDVAVFGASLNSCINAALKCFLMRYRDLLLLTPDKINRRIHVGSKGSSFSWVMNHVSDLGLKVFVLLDNLNAPLIKSTDDNIDEIHILLDRYLICPLEAYIRTEPIVGGIAVASPLSDEPSWTRNRTTPDFRDNLFGLITIDASQWEVAHQVLGFSKSEISALAAQCLPAEDVEPFMDDVMQTLESFDSIYYSPSTYSMTDVLAKLRKRTGQSDRYSSLLSVRY